MVTWQFFKFILLLNGWTLSPTNCNPQTWQSRRYSCPWVNTLCRRGTRWKTLADPKFISLTTIQCVCCNWRQHLQRLSPHGLHWPTVDEGLDTAALTSVSLMLLGHRNATTWPTCHFFQFLSNDDGRCLKFYIKRDGKWEQGEPVCLSCFLCTQIHTRSVKNQNILPWFYHHGQGGQHDNWFIYTLNSQININAFHPVVAILSTVLRVLSTSCQRHI
jgi:hypothetical protein